MSDSSSQNRFDFDESLVEAALKNLDALDGFGMFRGVNLEDLPDAVGRAFDVDVDDAIPCFTGILRPIARALAVASDELGIGHVAHQFQTLAALGPKYLGDESLAIASEELRTRLTNVKPPLVPPIASQDLELLKNGSQFAAEAESSSDECGPPAQAVGEPDGPFGIEQWRYNGQILEGKMKPKEHKIAVAMFKRIGWKILAADLCGPGGVCDGSTPDSVAKQARNVNNWLATRGVPLPVSTGEGYIWMERGTPAE